MAPLPASSNSPAPQQLKLDELEVEAPPQAAAPAPPPAEHPAPPPEPSITLEQAVAAESAARRGLDDQKAAHAATLQAAEAAKAAADAAVKQATAELQAREAAWRQVRETAWKTAHSELGPDASWRQPEAPEKAHGNGHDNGHGHDDHADPLHGAKHQLQHRWVEKTGFGAAERVVEHVAESLTERVLERAGERAIERGGERLAERAAERAIEGAGQRAGERMLERAGERVAERMIERGAERGAEVALEKAGMGAVRHVIARTMGETLRMGEHAAIHALKALRIIVPFIGMLFVYHLAHHDLHRMKEEKGLTQFFFFVAVVGDWVDILTHVVVVYHGIAHVDHHFLHTVERYGMIAAVVACFAVMAGEIRSARERRHAAAKKAPEAKIVQVHGHGHGHDHP